MPSINHSHGPTTQPPFPASMNRTSWQAMTLSTTGCTHWQQDTCHTDNTRHIELCTHQLPLAYPSYKYTSRPRQPHSIQLLLLTQPSSGQCSSMHYPSYCTVNKCNSPDTGTGLLPDCCRTPGPPRHIGCCRHQHHQRPAPLHSCTAGPTSCCLLWWWCAHSTSS